MNKSKKPKDLNFIAGYLMSVINLNTCSTGFGIPSPAK